MVKVKICGLTRMCDIEAANEHRPAYIGFIFAPKSRRYIKPEKALALRKTLSESILSVGVFVDEETENILDLINRGIISVVQLHGSESEDYIEKLKSLTNAPVIKAVSPLGKSDVEKWEKTSADYLLFDSINGGSGSCFNWDLISQVRKPYFLAGGLTPQNIKTALEQTAPYAVDVSSGVETDGLKDRAKIAEFIRRVRDER